MTMTCCRRHNYKFGQHPGAALIGQDAYRVLFDKGYDGLLDGVHRGLRPRGSGFLFPLPGPIRAKGFFVDGPEYETIAGCW